MKNQLGNSNSPYLLQHANNPVAWQEWSEQTLALARQLNKPIHLSIGYSSCHWCHVMAHECFKDEIIATQMNEHFINIKIDREQRPDLDKIYQSAHHLLTQKNGGWPLTVFLMPDDQTPFFAGTYFPAQPRHGLPSFPQILQHVSDAYKLQKGDIKKQNLSLKQALQDMQQSTSQGSNLDSSPFDIARKQIADYFDHEHGGIGQAPKFPHPSMLEFLLNYHQQTGDKEALNMATKTLNKMASGGLFDQVEGGFFRYSTDEIWCIPHFEKMLYDNAQLIKLYTKAHQVTGFSLYQFVVEKTINWLNTSMSSPEGLYYSALDADTDEGEGIYYTWTEQQLKTILNTDEYALLNKIYGFEQKPNFEGRWHLHTRLPLKIAAKRLNLSKQTAIDLFNSANTHLLASRKTRIAPQCDDKILTAWNALTIDAILSAARHFKQEQWQQQALNALNILTIKQFTEGVLKATLRNGKSEHPAYLDDYSFLLQATLNALQSEYSNQYVETIQSLIKILSSQFSDPENGGFYFTARHHEQLFFRAKSSGDDSIPSGTSIATLCFILWGYLSADTDLLEYAEKTLKSDWSKLQKMPYAHASMLNALGRYLVPPKIVVAKADPDTMQHIRASVEKSPATILIELPEQSATFPPFDQKKCSKPCCIWLCEGTKCLSTMYSVKELTDKLPTR